MHSQIVGQLQPDLHNPGAWRSLPIAVPYFDNKKLEVVFTEEMDEDALQEADKALGQFFKLTGAVRLRDSKQVYKNYTDSLQSPHATRLNISSPADVWLHVTPTEILVDYGENNGFFVIAFCECTWEEEHGLQLVFNDGKKLTRAAPIDGHYEDEDEDDEGDTKPWWKFW